VAHERVKSTYLKKTNNSTFTYGTLRNSNVNKTDIMTKKKHIAKQRHRNYTASIKMPTTCSEPTHDSPNDMANTCEYRLVRTFQVVIATLTFRTHSSGPVKFVLLLFR
jgi:hypothetical protein